MQKKALFIALFFLFIIFDSFSQSAICAYKYRKRIAFDPAQVSGSSDLTNFPALINITTDNDLRVVGSSGHVENVNGYDIVFTADDGVTLLNFQLEKYTSTSGQYAAWVRIPTLSTTLRTYIYMYYGNTAIATDQSTPATVWSNYHGVWHLQTGTHTTDNSGNGYTLTDNATTNQSPAFINEGRADNGTQWLEVSNTFPNITTSFTMSGWFYTADNTRAGQRIFCDDASNSGGYAMSVGDGGTGRLRFYSRGSAPVILDAAANLIANNTWYYCTGVADMTGLVKRLYINGVQVASGAFTGAWGTDAANSSIAGEIATGETANRLNGRIDEVRVAKSALSADWILTEYNNQNSPSTFYSITAEPYRWTGGTSTDWGTTTNWVGSVVPPADADITITNGTFQPTLDANRQIASLWVQSGATLSMSNRTLSVRFDITNCGTITGNTGTVTCNSTAAFIQNQYFSGSGNFNLYRLTVNNTFGTSPTLILNKDVSVTNLFTLTSGIVYTTLTNILNLTNTASSTSGLATSFVSGPMTKAGTTAFVFPVGKGTSWRRIGIGAPSSSTTFRAEYFNFSYVNTASVTAPIVDVSSMEYWNLDQVVGTGNAVVTLHWENATASGISNCPDLTIAHWTGASWDEKVATATGTCSGAGTGSISSNAVVTTFSPFTFGSKSASVNPLPIELMSFTAEVCEKEVCIEWSTASELNNDYFTIEKTLDGSSYSHVATIDGAGNSTSVLNYSTIDLAPFEGISYYRLKQTDFDGNYTYSALEQVDFTHETDFVFELFPNPTDGTNINMLFSAAIGEEILVVVYDARGRESYSKIIITQDAGENVYAIDPSSKLSSGIYFISATSKDTIYNKKLIVK